MQKEKSVGAVIFRKENKKILYLLLEYRRINDRKGSHTYLDFPKGHAEKGETEEETLRREVKEETGIEDLKIKKSFREKIRYFFMINGKLVKKEVTFFLAETKTEKIKISHEHKGFAWLDYEDAIEKIKFRNSKTLLRKAKKITEART
jgi:8-oxo-dGTP pyrophosphatase MutT (NUDIX family)